MTKSEIVKEISARTGIDGKAVLAVLEGFMNEVKTSLGKEENVYLRGFGSFIVKKRAQKTARNISKNTTMIIPAQSEYYYAQCYAHRNDYMISHACRLIAYWDGKSAGGTSYTFNKAQKKKLVIYNLF